jgi:serine/threonine-protein kinase
MVYVPGGTFEMGSTETISEEPVHSVTLDGCWIDRTEVTNAQYARCDAAGVCGRPSQSDSETRASYYGDSQYDEYPVIYVSWNDAKTYCEWTGGRLPTEAEWEYAARGPDGHVYPWGNDAPSCDKANYWAEIEMCVGDTIQVGLYPDGQNWVGALDMAGNVWEWVYDWYGSYPSEPQVNPTGPASGEGRVLRGGAWAEGSVHGALRYALDPRTADRSIGFRCVVGPGG